MALSNKTIGALEGKFGRIARTFARNSNLKVHLGGVECKTDNRGNIYLPGNSEFLSDDTQQVIEGMLDHEWKHQEEEVIAKERGVPSFFSISKNLTTKKEQIVYNAFEDIRIEADASRKYVGVAQNLAFNNEFIIGKLQGGAAKESKDPWAMVSAGIVAKAGGKDVSWLPPVLQEVVNKLADLAVKAKTTGNASETYELAKQALKRIEDMASGGAADSDNSEGEGEESLWSKPSKKPSKKPQKNGEPQKSQPKPEGEPTEPKKKPAGEEKSKDKPGDESEDTGEGDGEPEGDGQDGENESEGDSDGEGEEGDSEGEGNADSEGESEGNPSPAEMGWAKNDARMANLNEILEGAVNQEAVKEVHNHKRHMTHPEAAKKDTISTVKPGSTEKYLNAFETVRPQVSALRAKILTYLRAKKNRGYNSDRERGSLDSGALYSLKQNNKRVFSERIPVEDTDTSIGILIDQSGSMGGGSYGCSKAETAKMATIALSECLSKLNVPFAVWGFDNRDHGVRAESDERSIYNRFVPYHIDVYKDYGEIYNNVRTRLTHIHARGDNTDGDCVEWASRQVACRPEKRKILFVLSDGMPACSGSSPQVMNAHLQQVVRRAMDSGIEVLGIGIESDAVAMFYPYNVVLKNVTELPKCLFKLLKEFLVDGTKLTKKQLDPKWIKPANKMDDSRW